MLLVLPVLPVLPVLLVLLVSPVLAVLPVLPLPGQVVTSIPQVPGLPEDVHDDEGGDEVAQGQQGQGDEDGPEEVGRTLLLHLGASWSVRTSGRLGRF